MPEDRRDQSLDNLIPSISDALTISVGEVVVPQARVNAHVITDAELENFELKAKDASLNQTACIACFTMDVGIGATLTIGHTPSLDDRGGSV